MILFVDDEPFYVKSYVETLVEEKFDVVVEKLVPAIKIFEQRKNEIELVIADIMMASSGVFTNEDVQNSDLTTGFCFFDWLRQRSPDLPIIILTNKNTQDVDKKFESEANCQVFRKGPSCPTSFLVQQIREMLALKTSS